MARPRKPCKFSCPKRLGLQAVYKPAARPIDLLELIPLYHEELEAMHLCDGLGKTQTEAGVCMGVSRGTVQRLLSDARRKVAQALTLQQALAIGSRSDLTD